MKKALDQKNLVSTSKSAERVKGGGASIPTYGLFLECFVYLGMGLILKQQTYTY